MLRLDQSLSQGTTHRSLYDGRSMTLKGSTRFIATILASAVVFLFSALHATAQNQRAAEPLPRFEVASIKPFDPSQHVVMGQASPQDRVRLVNTAKGFIAMAYGSISRELVIGGPSWIDTDRFVIEAKIPAETVQKMQGMTAIEKKSESSQMLKSLLADRFALHTHIDSTVMPVYELVLEKSGLKLTEDDAIHPPAGSFNMAVFPDGIKAEVGGMTFAEFTATLQGLLVDRPVVDKTGTPGTFSFRMKISPAGTRFAGAAPESAAEAPSFFTAIQDLGLKLVPAKDPINTVVIDSVSKPSEN